MTTIETATTIPADWDVNDYRTWSYETVVDRTNHGAYEDVRVAATDFSHDAEDMTPDAAEWWSDVLEAVFDAKVAAIEADGDATAQAADELGVKAYDDGYIDLMTYPNWDDLELAASHCREITSTLQSARRWKE